MSSKKRRRGSGGHPARVSKKREQQRRYRAADPVAEIAAILCESIAESDSPVNAELSVSAALGVAWEGRAEAEIYDPDEIECMLGGELVKRLQSRGDPTAHAALATIASVSSTELALDARRRAVELEGRIDRPLPWVAELEQAVVTGALEFKEDVFDDERTLFVELTYPGGETIALGACIDFNLGGMATELMAAGSLQDVREATAELTDDEPGGEKVRAVEIDPGIASFHILDAIELTDQAPEPMVEEEFAALRAMAHRIAFSTPGVPADWSDACRLYPEQGVEFSFEERESLVEEFLASPEAAGLDPDGEGSSIARAAIDFAADYIDGRPLRWSPVMVDRFMLEWLPHLRFDANRLAAEFPAALEAWVRFAGRRRGVPAEAIETAAQSIAPRVAPMNAEISNGEASRATLLAREARKAGIVPSDEAHFESLLATYNTPASTRHQSVERGER